MRVAKSACDETKEFRTFFKKKRGERCLMDFATLRRAIGDLLEAQVQGAGLD
jgi:hypothetical protein